MRESRVVAHMIPRKRIERQRVDQVAVVADRAPDDPVKLLVLARKRHEDRGRRAREKHDRIKAHERADAAEDREDQDREQQIVLEAIP